jgi:SAM-dependent methyltransferase
VVGTLSERLDLKSLRHVSITHDSRILDVGCGNGFLLYDLMQAGFTALRGVDPYIEKSIEYENNLAVRKETIHVQQGEWGPGDDAPLLRTFARPPAKPSNRWPASWPRPARA